MTRPRTATHEETALLTVLKIPFRVVTLIRSKPDWLEPLVISRNAFRVFLLIAIAI